MKPNVSNLLDSIKTQNVSESRKGTPMTSLFGTRMLVFRPEFNSLVTHVSGSITITGFVRRPILFLRVWFTICLYVEVIKNAG